MIRRIHHVAIVVNRLTDAYAFYCGTLGLQLLREAVLPDQGVCASLLAAGDSEVELLEPLSADSGIGRFLARRGEGLHHVCFDTPDVDAELARLKDERVPLVDATPRPGLAGRIAFLHPKACNGVLTELATPPADEVATHPSTLRLKRLVIGAREPRPAAERFQALFGFPEVAMNGGPRIMLGVARGTLLVVPTHEVGGTEGLVALSLVAEDFPALMAAFDRDGTKLLRGTGEVTVEPDASHGVHLHISRYA